MADETLQDPGQTGYGDEYLTESDFKLPTVTVADGFDPDSLDMTLSLTGDNVIKLSDEAPGSGPEPDVPTTSYLRVRPSDIKDLEKTIMIELDRQVGDYPAFKDLILNTAGWIFLVSDPEEMKPYTATANGQEGGSYGAPYNPEREAQFKDPNPESTQAVVDSQNALVRAVADAYQLVGQMTAVLNNAAQNYVHADKVVFEDGTNVDDVLKPPTPSYPVD
ncbi:hypothetical protein [Micromonospora sp. WMMD1155]|uniref:hypothetical protein n=1 Tax=Micromonospora sp. WMMD1155 TaxID=3016094 RepID=UPI00249BA477|nr:hypothetical protein [Micromonospora sp. WMMD1155]WFE48814.1 hypothetical protein O7617_00100 [Micromonospora sp. WMMD1155]